MFFHARKSSALRSPMSIFAAALTALALIGASLFTSAPANAAVVQPTVTNQSFKIATTETDTTVAIDGQRYLFGFDFSLPTGTVAGDTFTITLPEGFEATKAEYPLKDDSYAIANGRELTVFVGPQAAAGNATITGSMSIDTTYTHEGTTENTNIDKTVEFNGIPVPFPIAKGIPTPADPDMNINKYSGFNDAADNSGQTRDRNKIEDSNVYGYDQWIYAADNQAFALWTVSINNYLRKSKNMTDPDVVNYKPGTDVVLTDTVTGYPAGFTPNIKIGSGTDTPATAVDADTKTVTVNGQQTNAEADLLRGNAYLWTSFRLSVIDEENPANSFSSVPGWNSRDAFAPLRDPEILSFSDKSFTFNITKYLAKIGKTASPTARYSLSYLTLAPLNQPKLTNQASVTASLWKEAQTDDAWYSDTQGGGWIYGQQPTTSLTVNKVWKGVAQAEAPAVTFKLLADGAPAKKLDGTLVPNGKIEAGASPSWTWTDLPTQSRQNVAIKYTVQELPLARTAFLPGVFTNGNTYTPDLTNIANIPAGTLEVTNERPVTKLDIEKVWKGVNPAKAPTATFTLKANGQDAKLADGSVAQAIVMNAGTTTGSWENLPVAQVNGAAITYSVVEETIDGYTTTVDKTFTPNTSNLKNIAPGKITITNTKPTTSVTVEKKWVGAVATEVPDVSFELLADGDAAVDAVGDAVAAKPVTATQTTQTWENLPVTNDAGDKIVYTVKENAPKGYTSAAADIDADGKIVVTNTRELTSLKVTKKWEGLASGEAAPQVEFQLLANGEPATDADGNTIANAVIASGEESATWSNIPVTTVKGEAITYTVKELAVAGFTSDAADQKWEAAADAGELTVTNTKIPVTPPTPVTPTTPTTPTTPRGPAVPVKPNAGKKLATTGSEMSALLAAGALLTTAGAAAAAAVTRRKRAA